MDLLTALVFFRPDVDERITQSGLIGPSTRFFLLPKRQPARHIPASFTIKIAGSFRKPNGKGLSLQVRTANPVAAAQNPLQHWITANEKPRISPGLYAFKLRKLTSS
jgi:hypothetical protein